jgi:hypothetical protein
MYVQQLSWQDRAGWRGGDVEAGGADLALHFGTRQALARDPAKPDHEIVHTVLAVDRAARPMTFAGDVPEGWHAQLMRGNLAAAAELGSQTSRIGFYSYGEISPHAASGICELRNQTMTVTTIAEAIG